MARWQYAPEGPRSSVTDGGTSSQHIKKPAGSADGLHMQQLETLSFYHSHMLDLILLTASLTSVIALFSMQLLNLKTKK